MLSDLSSILFETELSYPPISAYRITNRQVRTLYQELFTGGHSYQNLSLQTNPRVLSTKHEEEGSKKGESRCEVSDDSIRIIEDNPSMPVSDFSGVVRNVLEKLEDDCPPIFFQTCKIQCLTQPTILDDSLQLLAGRAANVADAVAPFGRWPSFFGIRFRFLPFKDKEPSDDEGTGEATENESELEFDHEQGFVTVRFETYGPNLKSVWMEAEAKYPCDPPVSDDFERIEENIRKTYDFLDQNCRRFLDQFDSDDDLDRDNDPRIEE